MTFLYLLRKWWLKHCIWLELDRSERLHRNYAHELKRAEVLLLDYNARLRELESEQMQRRACSTARP